MEDIPIKQIFSQKKENVSSEISLENIAINPLEQSSPSNSNEFCIKCKGNRITLFIKGKALQVNKVEKILYQLDESLEGDPQSFTIIPFEDILYAKYDELSKSIIIGLHKLYESLPIALEFQETVQYQVFMKTLESMEEYAIVLMKAEDLQVSTSKYK